MNHRFTIIALGEVLWDLFPDGARFGGAPANFACHAAQLGAQAIMVSRVGADELGDRAISALAERGVDTHLVQRDTARATGQVLVQLDSAGVPSYEIGRDAAWDAIEWTDELATHATQANAVCFGSLGQRSPASREVIQRFVAATPAQALRIFDINLRPPFVDRGVIEQSLRLANILKLNDEELQALAAMIEVSGSVLEQLRELARRFGLWLIALTRGERGAMLFGDGQVSDCVSSPVDVKDTVGAGDAFTAALALGLLGGRSLDEINRHACSVAAYVCTQSGATPLLPDELRILK